MRLPAIESIDLNQVDPFFLDCLKLNKKYCINFLISIGLLRKSSICCNKEMQLIQRERCIDGYSFYCNHCRKYVSVRKGSFFEGSHLDLGTVLKIIYYYSFDVGNQRFFENVLLISSKTIVDWKNFIRDVYSNYIIENSQRVGGDGVIVQVDESKLCKRKNNVGRILANQDQWIVGGIDENGNVFMTITTKRDLPTLHQIILNNVERGSIIWSDCWKGYRRLDMHGFLHETVNHSRQFVTETGVHTNRIEATWGACKRKFRHITNKSPGLIPSYLSEYIFKKKFSNNVFKKTLDQISNIYTF